jgi:adenylate cyclase
MASGRSALSSLARFLRQRRFLAIWGAGLVATVVVVALAFSAYSPLDRLNALVFDSYQTLKPRQPADAAVLVVDIDDRSIAQQGQWPWPRNTIARMVDRLSELGAAAIGFDILFAEPDRTSPSRAMPLLAELGYQIIEPPSAPDLDHDRRLAEAIAKSGVVVGGLALAESVTTAPPRPKAGFAFGGADPKTYLHSYSGSVPNLRILDEAAAGLGVISFPPERDGIIRRIPLVSRYGDLLYPALSMELLRVAQGARGLLVRSTGAHGELDTGLPGMVAIKNGALEVPTGPDGTIWIHYADRRVAPSIPAARLLGRATDAGLAELVAGRIVLIGTSAIGLRDIVATPLDAGVPGVFVHAEIIDQIIGGAYISRPDWAVGAEIVLAVALALLILAVLPWFASMFNGLIVVSAIGVAVSAGWLAFADHSILISPVLPVTASLLAYGTGTGVRLLLSESERRFIRSAFAHYLAPSMVQQLMDNPRSLVLGGEDREITILFCDIRGFTGISERLGATELTGFLNDFLTPMTDVLMKNGATIDKYMGDAIMAFWNAPLDVPQHREKACRSLVEMGEALAAFNMTRDKPVQIGVGLNTGVCCVGNLGSRQRFDYSAIGDPVNVASRTEGMTKQYGLTNLITDTTADGVSGLAMLDIDRVRLYGRAEATSVYTVLGGEEMCASPEFERLKAEHAALMADYRAMRFAAASRRVEELLVSAPEMLREFYGVMAVRIAEYAQNPPPPEWDGVYRAKGK